MRYISTVFDRKDLSGQIYDFIWKNKKNRAIYVLENCDAMETQMRQILQIYTNFFLEFMLRTQAKRKKSV
jgi:hypothetical protein